MVEKLIIPSALHFCNQKNVQITIFVVYIDFRTCYNSFMFKTNLVAKICAYCSVPVQSAYVVNTFVICKKCFETKHK